MNDLIKKYKFNEETLLFLTKSCPPIASDHGLIMISIQYDDSYFFNDQYIDNDDDDQMDQIGSFLDNLQDNITKITKLYDEQYS